MRPRDDFYKSAHPRPEDVLLIIEVADTSLQYDRQIKIPLYARHGIPEVWLVDLVNKTLTLFRSPGEQGYQEVSPPFFRGTLASAACAGWRSLQPPDLYEIGNQSLRIVGRRKQSVQAGMGAGQYRRHRRERFPAI